MAFLSKRMMDDVGRACAKSCGLRPYFIDLTGRSLRGEDPLSVLSNVRRKRDYALQESVNRGEPYLFLPAPQIVSWMVALEDRRMIHGAVVGGEVALEPIQEGSSVERLEYLVAHGMGREQAGEYLDRLPVWPKARAVEASQVLHQTFYQISGWKPDLMRENRTKALRQEQLAQAIDDQRRKGQSALYAFEKERELLANIRAGERNEARRILNEMLAAIYLSSPQLVVLRARSVELISCLTRAAIEDNPLMEPLIERTHGWTERLVRARSFEDLSQALMEALDDFIDGIYLHGANRSNAKVSAALDYIGVHFARKISLKRVSDEVGLSPCRLSHLVKECTGRTFLQVVQEARIRQAQHLLDRTTKSGTEIAYDVGFGDQSNFIRHFKRLTGRTPARFRRKR